MEQRRFFVALVYLAAVSAILPYLLLCFFIHPSADDFTVISDYSRGDIWNTILVQYRELNGRIMTNFVLLLNPGPYHLIWLYRTVPLLILSGIFFAFRFFGKILIKKSFGGIEIGELSSIMMVTILSGFRSLPEGLYWFTSVVAYVFSSVCFILMLGLFIEAAFKVKYNRNHSLFFFSGFFLSGCFSEVLTVFGLWIFTVFFLFSFISRKKLWPPILGLSFALVCMGLAPGTAHRASFYPDAFQFGNSVFQSFLQCGRFLFFWATNPLLWAFVLLLVPFSSLFLKQNPNLKKKYFSPLAPLLLISGFLFSANILPYLATGMLGQYRTINLAWIFIVPATVWLIISVVFHLQRIANLDFATVTKKRTGLLVLFFTLSLFSGNGWTAMDDLISGRASRFNDEIIERYTILEACAKAKADTCHLPLIKTRPESIFTYDITTNSEHWMNIGLARFSGFKGMEIVPENVP